MTTSASNVRFDDDLLWVDLSDGRVIGAPLAWFPRLMHATEAERAAYEISPQGVHWEGLDEDISVDGLLSGVGDLSRKKTPQRAL